MRDQDEIYEAATEEPATLGISAEAEGRAAKQPLGQCPSLVPGKVVVHDEPGGMDGAMGTSRPTTDGRAACPHAAVHVEPDYEMLARELTRDGFDSECLAKAIEAEASKRPIDYPTFYTPGWLVELAQKMQGEDKAAKVAEWLHHHYSFCDGLFPIRRANCEKAVIEHCWICGRRFTMEMSGDIHDDGEHVCCAKIRDNGKLIAKCVVYRGKSIAEKMAHETFKAYVGNLSGSGRLSSRGGFLKQALKRTAAAKAVNATAKKGGAA